MTDEKKTDKSEDDTTPIRPLPKCVTCGKILLHCTCSSTKLKK